MKSSAISILINMSGESNGNGRIFEMMMMVSLICWQDSPLCRIAPRLQECR